MTWLAGLELEHPFMNGAGICKALKDVRQLARSCVAAVVVGSITVNERAGNPGETYWTCPNYSLNSLGLPNPGLSYYTETLPEMAKIVHDAGKVLIVSTAGFDVCEYVQLAMEAGRCGADLIELNLGCPNVWNDRRQKRIACFDLAYTGRLCREVAEGLHTLAGAAVTAVGFGVKISPFTDPFELGRLAQALKELAEESPTFRFVTATNTFPNAFALDQAGKPRIDMGFGGLSGPAMKPIALGHV